MASLRYLATIHLLQQLQLPCCYNNRCFPFFFSVFHIGVSAFYYFWLKSQNDTRNQKISEHQRCIHLVGVLRHIWPLTPLSRVAQVKTLAFQSSSDFRVVDKSLWTCVVYQTCSLLLASIFFPVYYLLFILPFCAVLSELLTEECKSNTHTHI
jgi:hypothetical protein